MPRGHGEPIAVNGEPEPVLVKLGAWISNTKARRDKLSADQLAALAEHPVDVKSLLERVEELKARPTEGLPAPSSPHSGRGGTPRPSAAELAAPAAAAPASEKHLVDGVSRRYSFLTIWGSNAPSRRVPPPATRRPWPPAGCRTGRLPRVW